jgi:hypothetical protein
MLGQLRHISDTISDLYIFQISLTVENVALRWRLIPVKKTGERRSSRECGAVAVVIVQNRKFISNSWMFANYLLMQEAFHPEGNHEQARRLCALPF